MTSRVHKEGFKNIIANVSTHNRIQEEKHCWRQRNGELRGKRSLSENDDDAYYEVRKKRKESMKSDKHTYMQSDRHAAFLKSFDRQEAQIANRWDHSGFKELYPETFLSDDEDKKDSNDEEKKKLKKRLKKKRKSNSKREKSSKDGYEKKKSTKKKKKKDKKKKKTN